MNYEIIFPNLEHSEAVRLMRSDEEALKNSLTFTSPLSKEDFYPLFLEKYFTLPNLPSLFVWIEGKRAATLRFNYAQEGLEVSIVVDKNFRGQGIGYEILNEIKPFILERGYDSLYAEIKPHNIASIKIFEKAGFTLLNKTEFLLKYVCPLNGTKKVFVIAEAGSNWHTGKDDFERACHLIESAKKAGADAVKFQIFRSKSTYARHSGTAGYLQTDIEILFKQLEMPYDWIEKLALHADKMQIEWMASPFSLTDFKEINPYVKKHKIASFENNHVRLLEAAAKTQKPILISVGATPLNEIAKMINFLKELKSGPVTLLQCTSAYPAPIQDLNLNAIPALKSQFKVDAGFSDHSLDPFSAPLAATALGAAVIEKHFTLDNALPGPDQAFALNPERFSEMVARIREVEIMRGNPYKYIYPSEQELYPFSRRAVQALKPINKGDPLVEGGNIEILRPGRNVKGISPWKIGELKIASKDYLEGEGVGLD